MLVLIVYICLFILDLYLLVRAMKPFSACRLLAACLSELGSLLAALLLMRYFDQAPGYGMMPGLTYIQEVFYSFGAAVAFTGLLLFSLVLGVCAVRHKSKE